MSKATVHKLQLPGKVEGWTTFGDPPVYWPYIQIHRMKHAPLYFVLCRNIFYEIKVIEFRFMTVLQPRYVIYSSGQKRATDGQQNVG